MTVTTVPDSLSNFHSLTRLLLKKKRMPNYDQKNPPTCRHNRNPRRRFRNCAVVRHPHGRSTATAESGTDNDNCRVRPLSRRFGLDRKIASRCAGTSMITPCGNCPLRNSHLVDFIGTISKSRPASLLIHVCERRISRVAKRSMYLDCSIDYPIE